MSAVNGSAAAGRYALFANGVECGEERWAIAPAVAGLAASGEITTRAPHPFPSRQAWTAAVSAEGRVERVDVRWSVGERQVSARHAAEGTRWCVTLDDGRHVREQVGDYPPFCEVLFGSPLFITFAMRHVVLEPGAEHEFPALVIGPPFMAVDPGRQRLSCVERAARDSVVGPVSARRVIAADVARPEEAFAMWVDDRDIVLEALDGVGTERPWMRLVEYVAG